MQMLFNFNFNSKKKENKIKKNISNWKKKNISKN